MELVPGTPARTASGALVHTADTDGTRRLAVDGEPVTDEGSQVREVLGVDGESVLFLASDEPTEEHLWSLRPGRRRGAAQRGRRGAHRQRAGGALLLASRTEDGHALPAAAGRRPR